MLVRSVKYFSKHHSQQTERFFIAHYEPSDFPLLILGQISLLGKSVGKSYTLGRELMTLTLKQDQDVFTLQRS